MKMMIYKKILIFFLFIGCAFADGPKPELINDNGGCKLWLSAYKNNKVNLEEVASPLNLKKCEGNDFFIDYAYDSTRKKLGCLFKNHSKEKSFVSMEFCQRDKALHLYQIVHGVCQKFTQYPFYYLGKASLMECSLIGSSDVPQARENIGKKDSDVAKDEQIQMLTKKCESLYQCQRNLPSAVLPLTKQISHAVNPMLVSEKEMDALIELNNEYDEILKSCGQFDQSSKKDLAIDALYGDLEKLKQKLPKDVEVYHWFGGANSLHTEVAKGEVDLRYRMYLKWLQSNFYSSDKDTGTGLFGRGLYAAIDPKSTSDYGETLVKIKIPKGTPFLNNSKSRRIKISNNTLKALREAGCYPSFLSAGSGFVEVFKYDFSNKDTCKKIFNSSYKKTGSKFVTYSYNNENYDFCKGRQNFALVLTGIDFGRRNVHIYSKEEIESPMNGKEEKRLTNVKNLYHYNSWSGGKGMGGKLSKTVMGCEK